MPSCPVCRTQYPDGAAHCPADGEALLDDAAFSNVDKDLSPGDMVGEYRVEAKIGQGGFGSVYAAVHPLIGKRAALKSLHRQHSTNPHIVARFIAEAKAVNQIRHRNIIDIFSFGTLPDGRQYFLMELLEGRTLEEYFRSKGRLTVEEALPILRGIARALDAAHAKGIAHRDLKPENVYLVAEEGGGYTPKLLDFGVAKLSATEEGAFKTRTGAPIGTPYYMSPEQARGLNVDYRTDIYAMGVVAFQILTGSLPFDGRSMMDVLMKHTSTPAPSMSSIDRTLPLALDEPVMHMLAKDPTSRPVSAGAAIDELEAALRQPPSQVVVRSTPVLAPGDLEHAETQPPSLVHGLEHARTNAPSSVDTEDAPAPKAPDRGRQGLALAASVVTVVVVGLWFGFRPVPQPLPIAATTVGTLTAPPVVSSPGASTATTAPAPAAVAVDAQSPHPSDVVELVVVSTPPAATVALGTTVLGRAPGPFSLPVGSSKLALTVSAPGYKSGTVDFVPARGSTVQITLKKGAAPAPTVSPDLPKF